VTGAGALEIPSSMHRLCGRFEHWRSSHRGRLLIPETIVERRCERLMMLVGLIFAGQFATGLSGSQHFCGH
jgi:hypothetical protein